MDSVADRLNKMREERMAREKARIEKLRELNLKKYGKEESTKNSMSNLSTINKSVKSEVNLKTNSTGALKNNFAVNGTTKRPISVPSLKPLNKEVTKPKTGVSQPKTVGKGQNSNIPKASASNVTKKFISKPANATNTDRKLYAPIGDKKIPNNAKKLTSVSHLPKSENKVNCNTTSIGEKKQNFAIRKTDTVTTNLKLRQSLAVTNNKPKPNIGRKSMIPQSASKSTSQTSVFERLYKPKPAPNVQVSDAEKLRNDPSYLKKAILNSGLILNKRHTVFEHTKPKIAVPVRRSISAVHFKRIGKQELGNCIHKWSSIGDKLNNEHLKLVNEDENIKADKVVSAVKSERKKVTFMTPMSNFNTPRPEELQARLKSWLQKRGKSLDSYHHLQCFGIHHLPHTLKFDHKVFDEDNKENIALESDSDDDSYTENMNGEVPCTTEKWRTASYVSDSVDFNESQGNDTTITASDVVSEDDVVIGALKDLIEVLQEGFDWEQCARWLRAIRERYPHVLKYFEYWQCRAILDDMRGDLPASVQCWEEAIAKGIEHSVVDANLDQLLDKFMQLKISPTSGKHRPADPKLVDVKNVFKSTIIRFAVQKAKLRQSNQSDAPKFTITPVRRSGRLSVHAHSAGKRTPLQVCTTIRQADELALGEKPVFVPNGSLYATP
ncbi:hypothetical protein PYW07_011448 [Mythimna separata]|uniref:Cytoskeleton-associated protein 2-like n=1 Tax=Mythimna separata TaxID=271217 RepID=A0AAD7Y9C9_MYTSE|nr:hypothetical protein PYW07_011448 [Mythimna separata]